jgi:hypothetical protein
MPVAPFLDAPAFRFGGPVFYLLRGEKVLGEFAQKSDADIERVVEEVVHPGVKYRVVSAVGLAVEECLRLLAAPAAPTDKP